jgi:methyl-accepting chemotaxis protein
MKWTIGKKIGTGFMLPLAIVLIVGVTSYLALNKLVDSSSWKDHTYQVLRELDGLLSGLIDAETGQRGFLLTGEEAYLEPYNIAVSRVDAAIDDVRKLTADNPAQQQRIITLKAKIAEKNGELDETITTFKTKGHEAAVRIVLTNKGKKAMDEIRAIIVTMTAEEQALMARRSIQVDANTQNSRIIIIGGILLAAAILMLIGFLLSRNIALPLRELTRIAELIAAGDLSLSSTPGTRKDEVGILAQSFSRMILSLQNMANQAERIAAGDLSVGVAPQSGKDLLGNALARMAESLRRSTADIAEAVNLLGSSASEILAATTQVASSTVETATAINETTTTVEEVRQAARLSSDKAKVVAGNAQQVAQVSQSGQKAVEETAAGMLRIRDQMGAIAQTIVRLSEQGQSIGGIIATVTDLADQSNLLAVNAAIEAARAGEQGRGFAVVASEIKSLAEQSKQATAQIRGILSEVQKATGAAVMATEQGSKAVEAGVKQSAQAGDAIQALAESSAEAAQTAVQIVASSSQQVVGMDQIGIAMESINQAGNQTAASMRQAETAAQNLHELGLKLKTLVEQYRT